jgi:hypothetical protein
MTYQEIVNQARHLPEDERWLVVNELLRSLQVEAELKAQVGPKATADDEFSAERLRGILKPDGPIPTDREIKEDYLNYLVEKYN